MNEARKTKRQLLQELEELRHKNHQLEKQLAEPNDQTNHSYCLEEIFRQLLEKETTALLIINARTLRLEYGNPIAFKLFGYSPYAFSRLTAREIFCEPEAALKILRKVARGKTSCPQVFAFQMKKRDGSVFSAELKIGGFSTSTGEKKIYATVRDISEQLKYETELKKLPDHLENLVQERTTILSETNKRLQQEIRKRKQIEKALRESEQRYQKITASITDYFYTVYVEKGEPVKTVHSPNCIAVTGYAPEEFQQNPDLWIEMVPEEDREIVLQQAKKILSGKEVHPIEHRIVKKDGLVRWVRNTPVVYPGSDKQVTSYDGLIQDITERKLAQDALEESENRYRLISELTSDFAYSMKVATSGVLRLAWVTNAFARITGYSHKETRQIKKWEQLIHPEDLPVASQHLNTVLQGNTDKAEFRIVTKRGEVRWIRNHAKPFREENSGRVAQIFAAATDITEQKKIEQALHESEERYRYLIENQGEGISLLDAEEKFLYCNSVAGEIFGVAAEELIGRNLKEFVTPEMFQKIREQTSLRKKGVRSTYNVEIIRPDGKKCKLLITATPRFNENGEYEGAFGIFRDDTERIQAEEQQKLRLQFEKIISRISSRFVGQHSFDEAIYTSLAELGEFTHADRVYLFLFKDNKDFMDNTHEWCAPGVSPQIDNLKNVPSSLFPWWMSKLLKNEIIHIKDVDKLPQEARAEKEILKAQDIKSLLVIPFKFAGEPQGFLGFDNVKKVGQWKPEHVKLLRLFSEILGMAFEREQTQTALFQSVRRNEAMLAAMPDMMFVISKDGYYLDYKIDRTDDLAIPPREIIGKRLSDTPFSRADLRKIQTAIRTALETREVQTVEYELETPGGLGYYEARIARLSDNEVIANVRNISDRKKLEEELIKAEKLRSLGILAGGIAHDFNNLMTAIVGNISLAKMYLGSEHKALERLNAAEKAAFRTKDLTQQLLTFSKGGTPIKKVVSIATLIREAAEFALRGTDEKCELDIPDDIWYAEVDEGQINQVIYNLLINADEAMPQGGVIKITCRNISLPQAATVPLKEGNYIKISIKDQGTGIPREHLSRIFDPYFTTKQKGSGLGLATAYSIIQKHAGHITVESQLGKGTTFTIYLPASKTRKVKRRKETDTIYSGQGRILIMDDEKMVREIAASMLEDFGFDVDHATDGSHAIKMYKRAKKAGKPYAAVLMDLTIPGGMGGKETIKKLLKYDPEVKAIVSSGYSNDPIMSQYKDYGFSGVIAKPYSPKELGNVLQQVLTSDKRFS